MIHTEGVIQLRDSSLLVFKCPIISIVGQNTSRSDINSVNVDVEIFSKCMGESSRSSTTIDTNDVKNIMQSNSVDGASFVTNLYSILEELLAANLRVLNPDAIITVE